MLRHLGEYEAAGKIEKSVELSLKESKNYTRDLGGTATTGEITKEIVANLH